MDYQKQYNLLIAKHGKQIKPDTGYYECHHVVPTSLGGSDTADNKRYLTGKAHYIAHYLLWKIHDDGPMAAAFWMMSNADPHGYRHVANGRSFETARIAHSKVVSNRFKGCNLTDGHKAKISDSLKGHVLQEATKSKLSAAGSGHNNSRAIPANIYDSNTNELIAENVIICQYAKEHGYNAPALSGTARANRTKSRKGRFHKGIYAVYI